MSIEDYVSAQQKNLESIKKLPHFSSLGQLVNDLYELACRLVPRNLPPHYGKFLLLCHKSFLSALTLIGQAQPEDAAAITRRAIEMARLALAVKTNQENATNWLAFEKRMARWRDREEDIKPKPFSPKYDLPKDHLVMNALEKHLGILSDSYIHFTPEFFGNQDWIHNNTGIKLEYFTSDQRTIERELIALTGIHASILRILDECFDRALFASSDWTRLWDTLHRDGVKLAEPFAPSNSPAPPTTHHLSKMAAPANLRQQPDTTTPFASHFMPQRSVRCLLPQSEYRMMPMFQDSIVEHSPTISSRLE